MTRSSDALRRSLSLGDAFGVEAVAVIVERGSPWHLATAGRT